jgi:hypothetical protein
MNDRHSCLFLKNKQVGNKIMIRKHLYNFDNILKDYRKLYRVPTEGDGSCLMHAILRAVDRNYASLSREQKSGIIKTFREKLADSITTTEWCEHLKMYEDFINLLEQNTNLFRHDVFEHIIKPAMKKPDYNTFKTYITERSPETLHIIHKLMETTLENHRKIIRNHREPLGASTIKKLETLFDIDIYVITDNHGLPYRGVTTKHGVERYAVLIFWTNNHYETIVSFDDDTEISMFNPRDPLIIAYDMFLNQNPLINRYFKILHRFMTKSFKDKYPLR